MRVEFSDAAIKERILSCVPRPRKVAFVGKDIYQYELARSAIIKKFCKDVSLRDFNVDYYDVNRIPRATKQAVEALYLASCEAPVIEGVRLVFVEQSNVPVTEKSLPISSMVVYLNPPNPEKAEVIITIHSLYGRKLRSFTRSQVKSLPGLSQLFSGKGDVEFLSSNLYTGSTIRYQQELGKLSKLAEALPEDFIAKAKQYIRGIPDTRTIKIYKLLKAGEGSSSQLLKFIYRTVFIDKILGYLQVFNIISQHFFVNIFLAACQKSKYIISLPGVDNKVMSFFEKHVLFDKIFNCVVLKPRYAAPLSFDSLSVVPSISLSIAQCPGPARCGLNNYCSLVSGTLQQIGVNVAELVERAPRTSGICPLQFGVVVEAIRKHQSAFSFQWLYLLTGDREVLSGGQLKLSSTLPEFIGWGSTCIRPVGVRAIIPSRRMSMKDLLVGVELFQKTDRKFKLEKLHSCEIMALFAALIVYINKGKLLEDAGAVAAITSV